ncbi:ATP-binding protein [Tolypothrix bouteillei VB521301_2]
MRSAREGYYKVNSLDGIPRIFAFVPLGDDPQNPDAYVRIGIPLSVAFAKADWLLTRNLLGFGAVSILALVAAWVGGNVFLLEQVKSLVETTQQLKEGKLNARSRLVDEVGELGQLACAFNSMAESLEMRVNELQTLFDVLPIAIAIAEDPQCKYIRVNPAGAKLLKLAPDTNASITPSQGQLPPPYKIFRAGRELNPQEIPLQYAVHKGVKVQDVEIELVYQDGTAITLLCFATPLFDGENQPRGGICAFLDINERKQTEKEREQLLEREQRARAEAEAANRIKDEFLAVLSHELRTPLNPILGWSKLLRSREFDKTATDRALETIERNAKLQSQLIEDLLDVSRIIRGKLSLSSCPVDLFMTIQAAMETVRLSAQAKSIALKFSIDTSDGGVAESWDDNTENSLESEFQVTYTQYPISNSKYLLLGDSNRLQQVMWNLLSNAIKFTPNGGRVEIELSKEVNRELGIGNRETTDRILKYARVSVKDTGIGIDSVFLPYVFECFRQENSSTTRKFGGLGLGLAIVRHLVELHGGTVQAESQGIGLGATFTVRLPLTPDPLDVPQHEIQSNLGLNLQGIRILLVDDEPDARDFLTVSLEHYGAIVTAVPSAKEALAAIAQFQPDILLSDIGMPEVNGYMLMRQVRTLPPERGGQIPAIAITAYAGEFDRKQALQAGFQAHISKPIDLVNLVEEIASLALKPQLKMFNSP